jgi:5'-nucleotidase (lipoprotein e(P4) family)
MRIMIQQKARGRWLSLALLTFIVSLTAFAPVVVAQQTQADNTYLEAAVLWQQSSGERRALSYQTFTLARMLLDRDLRANRRSKMKRAIIVDVDDTVLDNSAFEAWMIRNHRPYESSSWTDWCNRAEATAVPGAVEFLRYANSRGVRVFYITNRKLVEKDGTATNLKKVGFPEVNEQTLLVRTDPKSSSKEPRRLSVSSRYRVVLLMGDDLNDFAEVFETSKSLNTRIDATERNKAQFGARFIVLPNPMYGHWEDAIYGEGKLTAAEKAEKRRNALKE